MAARKLRRLRFWGVVVGAAIAAVVVVVIIGRGDGISVARTEDGWALRGALYWTRSARPVVSGENVVVLERKRWVDFETVVCRLTAVSLADGSVAYQTELWNGGWPVQPKRICAWGKNVIVYGDHGNHHGKAGRSGRRCSVTVVGAEGSVISQFPLDFWVAAMIADEKNDILLCVQKIINKKEGIAPLTARCPQTVKMLSLPSGREIVRLCQKCAPGRAGSAEFAREAANGAGLKVS